MSHGGTWGERRGQLYKESVGKSHKLFSYFPSGCERKDTTGLTHLQTNKCQVLVQAAHEGHRYVMYISLLCSHNCNVKPKLNV